MKLFSDTVHRDQWQRYLKRYPVHLYKKGEIILMQDEAPASVRIIKTGLVKTYNINKHGEERPISFDAQSEIFPIGWIYDYIEKTQYFYEALTECEIYELPKKDFLFYLKLHPRMGYEMYVSLARQQTALQARIYALEQSRASEKIVRTLLYLCERFASPTKVHSPTMRLRLPLTQQELANFIGITRETTSTELKKLEKMRIIKHQHQQYLINVEKLQLLIE